MRSDMLGCRAHTAVKSDEDDEQGNPVLNHSDMSQGIMGTVTAEEAEQEYTCGIEMIYNREHWWMEIDEQMDV